MLDQPVTDADKLLALARLVRDMRLQQDRYFKGRSVTDLTASKRLEHQVDARLRAILDGGVLFE
jgi:hypothetical protein